MDLHTGVVDHDVQAVEVLHRLLDESHGLLVLRDICLEHEDFAVIFFDGLLHLLGFLLVMCVVHNNGRPFLGEKNSNSAADAAIGSGNKGNFLI